MHVLSRHAIIFIPYVKLRWKIYSSNCIYHRISCKGFKEGCLLLEHTEESSRLCNRYQSCVEFYITSESSHTLATGMLQKLWKTKGVWMHLYKTKPQYLLLTVAWIHFTKFTEKQETGTIRYWMSEPLQPTFYGKCAQEYKEAPRDCGISHVYTSFSFESDSKLIEKQRKQISQWVLKTTLVDVSIAQSFLDPPQYK